MKILPLISILFPFFIFSQVLDNREGKAFTDKPFFNQEFVKSNKLKKLKGTYTYKKQGQVMHETKYMYVYEFNNNGNLISTFETRTDDGSRDTTWNRYEYDSKNRLIVHKKSDLEGYLSIHYSYDSLDRLIQEEYLRDIDSNGITVRSLSFNKESFKYVKYDQQIKRTRFNNYDLPYLDEFFNTNELGYLTERIERIKMTNTVYTFHYEYNEKGKLSAILKSSNQYDGYLEEIRFKYDELGNLLEKHEYKKGIFTTDYQIIYNSKSKLLSSVITRQVSTNFMMILRFRDYEFFE